MSPAVAVPETECHSLTPWFIEPIEYLQRGYRSFRQMGVERAGVDVRTFGQPRSGECPGILLVANGLGRPRLRAFPYPLFGLKRNILGIFGSFGTRAWLHFPSLSSLTFTGPGPFKIESLPVQVSFWARPFRGAYFPPQASTAELLASPSFSLRLEPEFDQAATVTEAGPHE
jgi:hypothetical protein